LSLALVSNVALADHIGIYSDASGTNCSLAPGISYTTAVIHQSAEGAVGSRFRVDFAGSPGLVYYTLTYYFQMVGSLNGDLAVSYGPCHTGDIVLFLMVLNLKPGYIEVRPAVGLQNVLVADCDLSEHAATGGRAWIGQPCPGLPVASSTWGSVKALYR
jgi:hypothetical protein